MPQFAESVLVFVHVPPPQFAYPALHAKPQLVPSHVDVPFAGGAGHATHEAPHVASDELETQLAPQL